MMTQTKYTREEKDYLKYMTTYREQAGACLKVCMKGGMLESFRG